MKTLSNNAGIVRTTKNPPKFTQKQWEILAQKIAKAIDAEQSIYPILFDFIVDNPAEDMGFSDAHIQNVASYISDPTNISATDFTTFVKSVITNNFRKENN